MTSFINSQVSQGNRCRHGGSFTALFRIANIEAITRRLVKTMWTDISRLGKAIRAPSVMEVSVRMVDGISLLAPRLALARKNGAASEPGYLSAMNILSDLRVGLNMTRLLRLMPKLQRQGIPVHPVLEDLSAFYEDRMKDDSDKDMPGFAGQNRYNALSAGMQPPQYPAKRRYRRTGRHPPRPGFRTHCLIHR